MSMRYLLCILLLSGLCVRAQIPRNGSGLYELSSKITVEEVAAKSLPEKAARFFQPALPGALGFGIPPARHSQPGHERQGICGRTGQITHRIHRTQHTCVIRFYTGSTGKQLYLHLE